MCTGTIGIWCRDGVISFKILGYKISHAICTKDGFGSFRGPEPELYSFEPSARFILTIGNDDAMLEIFEVGRVVFRKRYVGVQKGLEGIWSGELKF